MFGLGKIKNQKGFTLVELLVVIAIIALLASVVLIATSNTRKKSNDTKRLADMNQIVKALELYMADHGQYPTPTTYACSGWDTSNQSYWFITPLVANGYIAKPPSDPINGGGCTGYAYAYYRYASGSYGCDATRGAFYVLGVRNFESGAPAPSPGWSCSGRNWGSEFQWVTGQYEH